MQFCYSIGSVDEVKVDDCSTNEVAASVRLPAPSVIVDAASVSDDVAWVSDDAA